jgi:D-aspartate ligase
MSKEQPDYAGAVVMNMFYTGLGIARSLGAHGVPVIGLSAKTGVYGNFTRYAKVLRCPDSREEPGRLLEYLIALGRKSDRKRILFPTRDHDLVLLDRFRKELEPYYISVVPSPEALTACLDKWETFRWSLTAKINTPRCWKIETSEDLAHTLADDITFPCVLKPISAYHWRQGQKWDQVGARKAIRVNDADELRKEYASIARAEQRALLQELVPGSDDRLFVAACYLDKTSKLISAFTAQKLIQAPEGFGTGCIVQTVDKPEIIEPALQLLKHMRFTGIAEVEFKQDSRSGEYRLIEVNPRPWDQHRLGYVIGFDVIYAAYCHAAGLSVPAAGNRQVQFKWIAEDVFLLNTIRSLWKRDGMAAKMWHAARGRRIYGVWNPRDPVPAIALLTTTFMSLAGGLIQRVGSALSRRSYGERPLAGETQAR